MGGNHEATFFGCGHDGCVVDRLGGGVAYALVINNNPGNMTVTAGANDQATVTFSAPISATFDPGGFIASFGCSVALAGPGTLTVSGTFPNQQYTGGTFNLGAITIACTASDETAGFQEQTKRLFFTVTVVDQSASFFNVPNTITVDAMSPAGAIVTYTAPTASESSETESFPATCSPSSGSTFAIAAPGNYDTVTCTATDSDGSTSSASFSVHVSGPAEQITTNLIAFVDSIPSAKKSFDNQLQMALADFNAGNTNLACGDLTGFINHVRAQSGKQLTAAQANQLIAKAQQIRAVLGCGR